MPPTPLNILSDPAARRAFTMHDRTWQSNRYVYPVVSRRSKGISIGVNLNPDKVCNFDCIYCSVDRTAPVTPTQKDVNLLQLREELSAMLVAVNSGEIYRHDPFDKIPPQLRRLNDIAFSGDGEPTTFPELLQVCELAAELKSAANLPTVKLVLITNATMFHRPSVRQALSFLDQNNGEIWAKLDAGTESYYHLIERTAVPFQRVLDNLLWCSSARPTVIQSLFMKVHGESPPESEIAAYADRLGTILSAGGRIKYVQLYTVARQTTEAYAKALSESELRGIARQITTRCPDLAVEIFP